MTHHDDASTCGDVLARFSDDGTKDLFRRLLEQALLDLIDAEVTTHIGLDAMNGLIAVRTIATEPVTETCQHRQRGLRDIPQENAREKDRW